MSRDISHPLILSPSQSLYTGLRPGEKLFEELFIPGESYVRTAYQKIFVASNGAANAACCVGLDEKVDRMISAAERGDRADFVRPCRRWCRNTSRRGRAGRRG